MTRMLAWPVPNGVQPIRVVGDEIAATIAQRRISNGTKRYRASLAIDRAPPECVSHWDLEKAKDDVERAVYERAKALLPRLQKYIEDYDHYHRRPTSWSSSQNPMTSDPGVPPVALSKLEASVLRYIRSGFTPYCAGTTRTVNKAVARCESLGLLGANTLTDAGRSALSAYEARTRRRAR